MAPFTYNNYYDPVGSQSSQQPQGYTYSNTNAATSSAQYPTQAASAYGTNYSQSYSDQYGNQAYSASGQQASSQPATSSNRPAQDYSARSNEYTSQYDSTHWNSAQSYGSHTYNQRTNRSQANTSPLYATHTAASTFGRLSLPSDQQTASNTSTGTPTYPNTSSNASTQNAPSSAAAQHRSYMTAYTQQQTQPPPRYASPAQAQQAQQKGHQKQSSRNVNQPSPQIAARNLQQQQQRQQHQQTQQQQRQQSTSVEPSPTTVDPSQVYDFRAEQERKARIDAEKRRKIQAEAAARKAEEDARKAEEDAKKAEEARVEAEKARVEAERVQAEEEARKATEEVAKKKAAQARKNEQRRKAREEKQKSKTAATALQQMASGTSAAASGSGAAGGNAGGAGTTAAMAAMMGDQSQPPANDEEAEMRAMFKKMREFNARNPDMLAKLWEEERTAHAATTAPQQPAQALPPTQQATPAVAPPTVPALSTSGYKPFLAQTGPKAPSQPSFRAAPPAASPTVPAPAQQQNTALWPPHKKGALAEAAAKWLALLPQNQSTGRTISREQVLKILDTNPSYVQLCEMIEKEGIRFERSALAKELLKAVPDGMKSQNGKAGPQPSRMTAQMNAAAAPSAPPKKRGRPAKDDPTRNWSHKSHAMPVSNANKVPYQTPSFSLVDAAREVNSMSTAPSYPAMGSLASALTGGAVQPPSDPLYDPPMTVDDDPPPMAATPEIKPEEPRRPPANKEEAARKRTFNDLVDLTKDDESEDEGPPRKVPFVPSNNRPSPGMPTPLSQQQRPPNTLDPRHMTDAEFRQRLNADPRTMQAPYQPMRNTLLSQQHQFPSMPPQPMPPQPMPPKPKGPNQENLQADRIRGKMLVEPIMRDRVARKSTYDSRTIARDVLLATGRHPDMRALNAHFNTMQHLLGHHGGVVDGAGNKSDLATVKWDIIDPGEPSDAAKVKPVPDANETEDASEHADDESEDKIQKPDKPERRTPESTSHTAKEIKPHRRPGRPRKSDAKPHKASRPSRPLGDPSSTSTPRPSTADSTSPSSAMSATGKPAVGYSAFNNTTVDENGNVVKKKGRPVGWRKDIHSRQANGLAPATPGSKPASSASRLRQSTSAASNSPNSALKQPHYQVFACGMRACTAQLDNIERLKKHLIKFHGNANDEEVWLCEWKDCKSSGTHVDKNGAVRKGTSGVASFETMEEWLSHVDKVHLGKLRWKLGDGPSGEDPNIDSDTYLSDATGRSVTTLIVPPSDSPQANQPTSPKQLKRLSPYAIPPLNPEPGVVYTKEQKAAIVELKKLQDIKRKEGGILGRMGGRLANEKRRRGFLDDEDFEEVVVDSD